MVAVGTSPGPLYESSIDCCFCYSYLILEYRNNYTCIFWCESLKFVNKSHEDHTCFARLFYGVILTVPFKSILSEGHHSHSTRLQVEIYYRQCRVKEIEKVEVVLNHLKGTARDEIKCHEESGLDFEKVRQLLHKHFRPVPGGTRAPHGFF